MTAIRDNGLDVGQRPPSPHPATSGSGSGSAQGPEGKTNRSKHFGFLVGSARKRRSGGAGATADQNDPAEVPARAPALLPFHVDALREAPPAPPARPALRVSPHQRVLVGSGGAAGQARIQIGSGRLAGSEIQLSVSGSLVDARLLTSHEASRQTLVTAMEGARQRLRERGLLLRTVIAAPGSRDRELRDADRSGRGAPRR
jgi:hypothetical protein